MANTFLHAQGIGIGKSLCGKRPRGHRAAYSSTRRKTANCAIILPVDAVVAFHKFKANSPSHAYGLDAIPADGMILDVGPTIHRAYPFGDRRCGDIGLERAARRVRNDAIRSSGTMVAAAKHAAERTKAKKLISVAGGGDTAAAMNHAGVAGDFSYISTAGGAFLEWMEGKPLPGVAVLKRT